MLRHNDRPRLQISVAEEALIQVSLVDVGLLLALPVIRAATLPPVAKGTPRPEGQMRKLVGRDLLRRGLLWTLES